MDFSLDGTVGANHRLTVELWFRRNGAVRRHRLAVAIDLKCLTEVIFLTGRPRTVIHHRSAGINLRTEHASRKSFGAVVLEGIPAPTHSAGVQHHGFFRKAASRQLVESTVGKGLSKIFLWWFVAVA